MNDLFFRTSSSVSILLLNYFRTFSFYAELLISVLALTHFLHFIYCRMLLVRKSQFWRSSQYCIAFVIQEVVKIIFRIQFIYYLFFAFVCGHSQVLGNDRADQLAKEATGFKSISLCLNRCFILRIYLRLKQFCPATPIIWPLQRFRG